VREGWVSKKAAEIALENAPRSDVERLLWLMYKLHASSMVSTEAIMRHR
jgi:hypothetical protein